MNDPYIQSSSWPIRCDYWNYRQLMGKILLLSLLHLSVVQNWETFLPSLRPSKIHSGKFGWFLWVTSPREIDDGAQSWAPTRWQLKGQCSQPPNHFVQSCIAGQGKKLQGDKSSSHQLHHMFCVTRHQYQGFRFAAPALTDLHWLLGPEAQFSILKHYQNYLQLCP